MNRRCIWSLQGLLTRFGVTFEVSEKVQIRKEIKRLHDQGVPLGEALKQAKGERPLKLYLAEIEAYPRDDMKPPTDLGVLYGVISWDERAGEDLHELLGDLVHAASCGCEGCADRINGSHQKYRDKVKEDISQPS